MNQDPNGTELFINSHGLIIAIIWYAFTFNLVGTRVSIYSRISDAVLISSLVDQTLFLNTRI